MGQTAGALSSVLVNVAIAISIGATAIINSLQGIQYVFVLLIVVFMSKKFPKVIKEELTKRVLIQKIIATVLIIIGVALIAF